MDPHQASSGPTPSGAASSSTAGQSTSTSQAQAADDNGSRKGKNPLPSINLPKGGGAIRSIGEKFSVNSVTGTASTEVPVPISTSRGGFGPTLSISYDSGSGNGPFGFGWQLNAPSITRKTDKGLPQYLDEEEGDLFIIAGSEDLVPDLDFKDGTWSRSDPDVVETEGTKFEVRRYRPRIEGSFVRIERWTEYQSREIHWRTITGNNVTTLYGDSSASRISDPICAPGKAPRTFKWLMSESWDDKGNWLVYEYKAEDSANVDITAAHESCRTEATRTSQRYIKRIKYGNRTSRLVGIKTEKPDWMFEAVFDYGDHGGQSPTPKESQLWPVRPDSFSSYRSAFEIRTYRLCHRILLFHHFPNEKGVGADCLVSSFEIQYVQPGELHQASDNKRVASFVSSFTSRAYQRQGTGYFNKALPPIQFKYSEPEVSSEICDLNSRDLAELPFGLDDAISKWIDLDSEGIPGILTKQGDTYHYKANMGGSNFFPNKQIDLAPAPAASSGSKDQWMDLAASGHLSLVRFDAHTPGFYRRDWNYPGSWHQFKPFESLPSNISLSNAMQFLDLTGDGLTDILIANDEVFVWYPSLGEAGYGNGRPIKTPVHDRDGARLLVSDKSEAIYVADMSGDGLTDLVRIRQDEVCYWPNLGYGEFGPKVTMDNAPCLDLPDLFRQDRIRLFDIDGSGTTDIIYLGREEVFYYRNESGNSWSAGSKIIAMPMLDNASQLQVVDLFGRGTGTLVWSSTLPSDRGRHIRYIDLMGNQKPHLLTHQTNNLGVESKIFYKTSTEYYLQDKLAGRPWLTRLAFPVQVVERQETYDYVSKNKFVSRFIYHDGYYDWFEREFRGFAMVEKIDTEEFAAFSESSQFPEASNTDERSHVPPILTKSWFHTGDMQDAYRISKSYEEQYYREAGLTDEEYESMLLPDTVLPTDVRAFGRFIDHDFSTDEIREACRSLKGKPLRTETYALDGSEAEDRPYSVSESNYSIMAMQPIGPNKNAVYLSYPRDSLSITYEREEFKSGKDGRTMADPRVSHSVVLRTDELGQVLLSASIVYGRRHQDPSAFFTDRDRDEQRKMEITFTETNYTNMIWDKTSYRLPLSYENRTYQLLNFQSQLCLSGVVATLQRDKVHQTILMASDGKHDVPYEDYDGSSAHGHHAHRRLLKHSLSTFRSNDFTHELPPGELQSLAVSYMSYDKSISAEYAKKVYVDSGKFDNEDQLKDAMSAGGHVHISSQTDWWIPSGRVFYSPSDSYNYEEELEHAKKHFFNALRYRDPFYSTTNNTEVSITYDDYDLLVLESKDARGNRITAGIRNLDPEQPIVQSGLDYRLLKPILAMDPNRNCTTLVHDVLGYVAGCAIMGKPENDEGDNLEGFDPNLSDEVIQSHFASPLTTGQSLIGNATVRYVYDINAFYKHFDPETLNGPPTRMSTIARMTHSSDLVDGEESRMMYNISYFDGLARTIQSKSYAGPGLVDRISEPIAGGLSDTSELSGGEKSGQIVPHRWICSGWNIFNNKGSPVRKYEPFYSSTETYEFNAKFGVSGIMFYDALGRVVATLFPDHSWSKAVFGPWSQQQWDANDTVDRSPLQDPDVGGYFKRLILAEGEQTEAGRQSPKFQTWYEQRIDGRMGTHEQAAARKSAVHAETPTIIFLDSMGRAFLTVEHNRWLANNQGKADGKGKPQYEDEFMHDITIYDIEGNKHAIIDSKGRKILEFHWDMSGTKVHQASMEAGHLWMLHDINGNLVHGWDSRKQRFRNVFDNLRRSIESHLCHDDDRTEKLVERTEYGEFLPNAEERNIRTRPIRVCDQAGTVSTDAYDFKGNVLATTRRFAKQYKGTLDWVDEVVLEDEMMIHSMRYDAANRKIGDTTADGSILNYYHSDVGLIQSIKVQVAGAPEPVAYLQDVEYNARGQRIWVQHGNKTVTASAYDDFSFRLKSIVTYKNVHTSPRKQNPQKDKKCAKVQDLYYTYDPIGNVTHIHDDVQDIIYFRNKKVDPSSDYVYDAAYRLIEATGREHLGQANQGMESPTTRSPEHFSTDHAHDDGSMARYTEIYAYDSTGNCLRLHHISADEKRASWTRHFTYQEPSQLEPEKMSNRLSVMRIGSKDHIFKYEGLQGSSGNVTSTYNLPSLNWDYKNQLASTSRRGGEGEEFKGEITYYRYDARGQRVRKVTEKKIESFDEKSSGTPTVKLKERIYYGPFEVFRRYKGDGKEIKLERQTLHVADEAKMFALVETRTIGEEKNIPRQVIRYQLTNSTGSVQVELNHEGDLLSYEEYSPFGDTTYSAWNGSLGSPKRYRYSGKEKDEESGLYYYGARYYLTVAMRWLSPDPGGWKDGSNLYQYVKCNPVSKTDFAGTEASWWNRAVGVATVVGGALEIAAGAAGLAAPTGVTQVLGAVAVVHGADTVWAGLKQAYTGEEQKTFTEQGATKLAEAAGASKETAAKIGMGVDMAVGIIPDAVGSLAKNGPKLLSKAGSALEKTGSALKSAGKALGEGGSALKKVAIEAAHELGRTGAAVLEKGKGAVDEIVKVVKNPGMVVTAVGDHGMSMMMTVFDEGKAAVKAVGGGGGGKGNIWLSQAERGLKAAAQKLEKARGWVGEVEKHHIFPQAQEFRDMFRAAGINIHEYTFALNKAAHRIIHGKHLEEAGHLALDWNKAWETWIQGLNGRVPGKEEIFKAGEEIMEKTGVMAYFEEGGKEWIKYEKPAWVKRWLAKIGKTVDDFDEEAKILGGMKK
ncbi:SpvB domain-containing protein [Pochonia chlamydosporia 170]|uniref:SpvB domain-containing protein n=1 Tax=Pochonia chlamydosporia 170 TaxID=1380566 RepID=A0A179G9U5_METCM|nr:SpvB domain-containing protein [Pochonia chlamydosporia 170]OAQ74288.1 SpvB domain-containing protein [Pochonia chlamydosporia 170]